MSDAINLNAICRNGGTQMREAIDPLVVEQYAEHIADGAGFPPIVVFYDGQSHWLADGFHRCAAYEQAGVQEVPADIRSGQRLDALRYALRANATNGKPRTSGDMRRAYQAATEAGLCDASDSDAVRDLLGCSMRWARSLTSDARQQEKAERDARISELHQQGMSQREIAEEVGAGVMTVSDAVRKRNSSESVHPSASDDSKAQEDHPPAPDSQHNHRAQGTGENEWYTPDEYLEAARSVLGGFDLDPASSDTAQEKIKAGSYYTKDDDGLASPWHGSVWLNPPYSQPLIMDFIERACEAYESGEIEQAIILTHNYTDTRWFHRAASASDAICFTRGRIKFYSPTGEIAAPTQGQAFFYLGPDVGTFHRYFSDFGFVMVRP